MKSETFADILKLSVEERIRLAEEIWESIAAFPEAIELTPAQCEELDRRLEAYRANPDAGSTWDEVRKRVSGPE
jgi:putative addiction module component (TIGR02574 family)